MVHVRRWIQRPKCAIQIRRIEIERDIDPAREERLKAVTGANVFLDPVDVRHEIRPLIAGGPFDRRRTEVGRHRIELPGRS